jgi:hypothetical protein
LGGWGFNVNTGEEGFSLFYLLERWVADARRDLGGFMPNPPSRGKVFPTVFAVFYFPQNSKEALALCSASDE